MSQAQHIISLNEKYKKIDEKVKELEKSESTDHLEIAKLKKERLAIKDKIVEHKKKLMAETALEK